MNLSVVVPVFNSQGSLDQLVEQIASTLGQFGITYEIILVNDGSIDGSWLTIQELALRYKYVRGINLSRNFGQHRAILCGIRAAIFRYCVVMDDDLQHPPSEIPKLLLKLESGFDLVYGSPIKKQQSYWRRAGSILVKQGICKIFGMKIFGCQSAFRAFRTQLRDSFSHYHSSIVNIDALISEASNRFVSVPVKHESRKNGSSNYTIKRLLNHAMDTVLSSTRAPLMVTKYSALSVIFLAGALISFYTMGITAPTAIQEIFAMAALAACIAQLLSLSLTACFLSRIYSGMMSPQYIVMEDTDSGLIYARLEFDNVDKPGCVPAAPAEKFKQDFSPMPSELLGKGPVVARQAEAGTRL